MSCNSWISRVFSLALLVFLPTNYGFRCSSITKSTTFHRRFSLHEKSALLESSTVSSTKLNINGAPLSPVVTVIIPSNEHKSFFAIKPFNHLITWHEAFEHIQEKLGWEPINNPQIDELTGKNELEGLSMEVITLAEAIRQSQMNDGTSTNSAIVILVDLPPLADESKDLLALASFCQSAKAVVPLWNPSTLSVPNSYQQIEHYGDFYPTAVFDDYLAIWDRISKSRRFKHRNIKETVRNLWSRKSTGDILFMLLVLIDSFSHIEVKTVKSVTSSDNTSFDQFYCMATKCTDEIAACLTNENCKKALDCLEKCKGNDQVCSYRCIVSYESEQFENFAKCILQRNNCMKNSAVAPIFPDPFPMTMFRNEPLTHEVAEGIFQGWLLPRTDEKNPLVASSLGQDVLRKWSWKVVCGQNPAYDYFSNQHQLFYKDKKSDKVMWYDPVFQVTTLAGISVWRRRHYRVRRGKIPGQFYFSVLDNGVTSSEFWRIVDCDDNLDWAVFYYTGAAVAAGTSYTGALLVTRDGQWPVGMTSTDSPVYQRIELAMKTGGNKMWELFQVLNEEQVGLGPEGPPPLEIE